MTDIDRLAEIDRSPDRIVAAADAVIGEINFEIEVVVIHRDLLCLMPWPETLITTMSKEHEYHSP